MQASGCKFRGFRVQGSGCKFWVQGLERLRRKPEVRFMHMYDYHGRFLLLAAR